MRRSTLGPFRVEIPETRRERRRGLLGRDGLDPGHGMLLERARSVHTFGMRFSIRVAFLDRDYRVLQTKVMCPGAVAWCLQARHALELGAAERVAQGSFLTPADAQSR
jgi:uncharacterized protein